VPQPAVLRHREPMRLGQRQHEVVAVEGLHGSSQPTAWAMLGMLALLG
jgi:hypothetical protein